MLRVISYSTSPCSAPGTRSSYGSPETNARAKVSPTAVIVVRDGVLAAMVWAKIRLRPTSPKP